MDFCVPANVFQALRHLHALARIDASQQMLCAPCIVLSSARVPGFLMYWAFCVVTVCSSWHRALPATASDILKEEAIMFIKLYRGNIKAIGSWVPWLFMKCASGIAARGAGLLLRRIWRMAGGGQFCQARANLVLI